MRKKDLIIIIAVGVALLAFPLASFSAKKSDPPGLMIWKAPPAGAKAGMIDGLDKTTLAELAESGALQYFQPRHEEDRWDIVVGMMVHAPADMVWEVATDYQGLCKLLPDTFDSCRMLSKTGGVTRMKYQAHTSVAKFSFDLDITDVFTEIEKYHWKLDTVEGSLKGRQLELLIVPMGEDLSMTFLRYYGSMRSIGGVVKLTLMLLPDLESPVYASAATYHMRSYKNEAEKRAGYTPPKQHAAIDYAKLDPDTVNKLCAWYGGLVHETKEGKTINAMAFSSINAPAEVVWKVMTDFDRYNDIFPDSDTVVEKRSADEVVLKQSVKQIDLYVFSFGFELHARYKLEPPTRMSYVTIDGVYKDTTGDFFLVPYDGGKKTFVYATIGVMMDRDESFTMNIVRSGEFPFDSMVNMFFARDVLNKFKAEAERRG